MNYEAKFTEVKQARLVKPEVARSCRRHNSERVDAVISGTGRLQENRIFRFLNIHNKIALILSKSN